MNIENVRAGQILIRGTDAAPAVQALVVGKTETLHNMSVIMECFVGGNGFNTYRIGVSNIAQLLNIAEDREDMPEWTLDNSSKSDTNRLFKVGQIWDINYDDIPPGWMSVTSGVYQVESVGIKTGELTGIFLVKKVNPLEKFWYYVRDGDTFPPELFTLIKWD